MSNPNVFVQLRDSLAELYPDVESARRLSDDAGINLGQINFNTGAINFWHAILSEAARIGKGDNLLKLALAEYSQNRRLNTAYNAYLAAGQRLIPPPPPGASKDEQRAYQNRHAMLKRVHDIWVKGVLEHSLYNQLLIDLEMEQRPEAVERPWGMVLEIPEQASRLLPTGTKIVNVFAERNQSLLILGEPGSGKSTMLLELARDLLDQATQNPALPMPVLFNLSSWAEKRQPLRQWLVNELREKYQIPKALAQAWVEHDELLLLLDGLDEVKREYREDCIKALNEFQQSGKTLVPVALCSRTAEYEALTGKLKLNGAIVLRQLTPQQINSFLLRGGNKLNTVAHLLQHDAELQTLAESPLTFSILCLTYQDKTLADIEPVGEKGTRLQKLFDAYIRRMFQRPGKLTVDLCPQAKTLRWLAWLAARMVQYAQTEFLIERLQPDWLQFIGRRRIFVNLLMFMWGPFYGTIYGLIYGMIIGSIFWLIFRLSLDLKVGLLIGFYMQPFRINDWLIFGLNEGSRSGLGGGVIYGLIDWLSGGITRIPANEKSNKLWQRLRSSMCVGLFWSLVFGLSDGVHSGMINGLSGGLSGWLLGALFGAFKPVRLTFQVRRSWRQLKTNLIFGLIFGVIDGLNGGMSFGLPGGLIFGLVFESGAKPDSLNIMATQVPNQDIKQAAKSSLLIGVIYGLGIGLNVGLFSALKIGLFGGLGAALIFGLSGGLIGGVVGGGDIVMKHLILRFALYSRCYAPLNYVRFLDYCADCIFLRKVGGGYIFIHRLLMEHFATMTEEDIQRLAGSNDDR